MFLRQYSEWWINVITHLSKPTERTTLKVNLNLNYGLLMMMMHSWKFIDGNRCTTVLRGDGGRAGCVSTGQEVYGNSLDLPFSLAVNLNLVEKIKSI